MRMTATALRPAPELRATMVSSLPPGSSTDTPPAVYAAFAGILEKRQLDRVVDSQCSCIESWAGAARVA